MPVYRFLDLSTEHITETESIAVDRGFPEADEATPRVIRHDYGWWVNVPSEATGEAELAEHYPNVAACLRHARSLDCVWINFDQDAGHEDVLPVFEWA